MKKEFMKRALCLACCLSLTLGMFAYRPPKAQAVVIDATAAFGAAAVTAAINGTTATTVFTGMGTSAATGTVIGLMDTYAAATGVAASGAALASSIATGILVSGGVLLAGAAAAALIGGFIDWLREQEGLEAGGAPVTVVSAFGFNDKDGNFISFGRMDTAGNVLSYGTTWYPVYLDEDDTTQTELFTIAAPFKDFGFGGYYLSNLKKFYCGTFVDGSMQGDKGFTSPPVLVMPALSADKYLCWIVRAADGTETDFAAAGSTSYHYSYFFGSDGIVEPSVAMQPKEEFEPLPDDIPEGQILSIDTGLDTLPQDDPQGLADAIMQPIIDGTLNPTVGVESDPNVETDPDIGTETDPDGSTEVEPDVTTGWLSRILEGIKALPQQIAEAVGNIISSIFAPDAELVNEITGTFSEKFGFVETLKVIGDDLFGMTPGTEPPVVWIHLEDAEGKYYYGGTVKALDMSWFQRYKEDTDRILGGFLWVAYLWLLFRRLPDILGGAGLVIADSQYIGDGMYVDGNTGEITGRFMYRRSKRL